MRPEDLREMLRQQPFQTLRLHLTDGAQFEIRHPEMALLSRSYVDVGREDQPGSGIAASTQRVNLLHIVRVERADERATLTTTSS